jgi:hypothetical protein
MFMRLRVLASAARDPVGVCCAGLCASSPGPGAGLAANRSIDPPPDPVDASRDPRAPRARDQERSPAQQRSRIAGAGFAADGRANSMDDSICRRHER